MTLIKSMTDYGRAVETVNGREFTVELRSVNNRYLDCSVRLPRVLSFAEDAVKQAVKRSVSRGKVDVFISLRTEGGEEARVSLNEAVLEGYLSAMRQMVTEHGVADLRGKGPDERAEALIENCAHPDYRNLLWDYLKISKKAHISHNVAAALALHTTFEREGDMRLTDFNKFC